MASCLAMKLLTVNQTVSENGLFTQQGQMLPISLTVTNILCHHSSFGNRVQSEHWMNLAKR